MKPETLGQCIPSKSTSYQCRDIIHHQWLTWLSVVGR